ncbi:eCIS core domain-containing protein [Aquimarina megaterium]|uniref:eCIS core domain-containing protein n=1 Tax=Aquimarina megaterium TaxID=1443666 RepID=UPI0009453CC8|nr:DUF4157 domain-containing protein [Aquimarina megaterium]
MRLQRRRKSSPKLQQEKPFIQPKLKVGKPGDKHEVEADQMADQVVNNANDSGSAVQKKGALEEDKVQASMFKDRGEGKVRKKEEEEPVQAMEEEEPVQKQEEEEPVQAMEEEEPVQKQEEEEPVQAMEEEEPVQKQEEEEPVQAMEEEEPVQKQEEEEPVQAMEEEEPVQKQEEEEPVQAMEEEEPVQKQEEEEPVQAMEEEEPVQAKEEEKVQKKANNQNGNIESKLKSRKGKGTKLSGDIKNEMETGFGASFNAVNIHTDTEAVQMSEAMGAQAFTNGNDIYFNKGKYNPNSKSGKHLLAHELTHTIQQKGKVKKNIQKQQGHQPAQQQTAPINVTLNMALPNNPTPNYSRTADQLGAWEKADFHFHPQITHRCAGGNQQSYVQEAGITLANPTLLLFVARHIHENASGYALPRAQRIPWIQIKRRILAHATHHFTIYRDVVAQMRALILADLSALPSSANPANVSQSQLDTFLVSRLQYWMAKLRHKLWEETCNWEHTDYPRLFRDIPSVSGSVIPDCGSEPPVPPYPIVPTRVNGTTP